LMLDFAIICIHSPLEVEWESHGKMNDIKKARSDKNLKYSLTSK